MLSEPRSTRPVPGVIGVLVIAIGCSLLVLSWRQGASDDAWWSATLANAGVAVLVFVPLYWLGRRLDDRINDVKRETEQGVARVEAALAANQEENQRTLRQLQEKVNAQIAERELADQEVIESVRRHPSRASFEKLHTLALERGWLRSYPSARVAVDEGDVFVEIPASLNSAKASWTVIRPTDGEKRRVTWPSDRSAEDFFTELRVSVESLLPPGATFSLEALIEDYAALVRVAASHARFHGAVALFPPQWALCRAGLAAFDGHDFVLPPSDYSSDVAIKRVLALEWLDAESFEDALAAVRSGLRA